MAAGSDLEELQNEVAALRAVLMTIAPLAFATSGVRAEHVEAISKSITDAMAKLQIAGCDQNELDGIRASRSEAIQKIFADVTDMMRARARGDIDIAS